MKLRAGVDREKVIATAARLANADGLAALTLGAVAAELKIRTPSLYTHVAGLDDVHAELRRAGMSGLLEAFTAAAVGRSGDEALRHIALAYRDYARRQPGLYAAANVAPPSTDKESKRLGEAAIAVLMRAFEAYELDDVYLIHAARTLRSAMHGWVTLEALKGFGYPVKLEDSWNEMIEIVIAGVRARRTKQRR